MKMEDEINIAAPRELVFAALNDPEVLKQAIPGCQELEKLSETEMTATVQAKVGPVKAKFKGRVTLSDIHPPEGYTISGEGTGGAAGFAKGGARVTLVENGAATVLRYTVDAEVGGKLAQIGNRLIEGTSKKLAGEFFESFSALVTAASGPQSLPEETSTLAPGATLAAPTSTSARSRAGGVSPWTWAVAVAVLGLVGIWLLNR